MTVREIQSAAARKRERKRRERKKNKKNNERERKRKKKSNAKCSRSNKKGSSEQPNTGTESGNSSIRLRKYIIIIRIIAPNGHPQPMEKVMSKSGNGI